MKMTKKKNIPSPKIPKNFLIAPPTKNREVFIKRVNIFPCQIFLGNLARPEVEQLNLNYFT